MLRRYHQKICDSRMAMYGIYPTMVSTINVKKTICVVFDCASSYKGTSLNKVLLQGPDLANSLICVLLRFHQEPVAIMADIEGMFHQVRVKEEDRNLLRFLWWPGWRHKQRSGGIPNEGSSLWRHILSNLCTFCTAKTCR